MLVLLVLPSLASHTLCRERKGLVMLQPWSCPHSGKLVQQIRSALFVDSICCYGVQLCHNVFSRCQHLITVLLPSLATMFDNCIPQQQLISCNMTRQFLSLRRVWLARLCGAMLTCHSPSFWTTFVHCMLVVLMEEPGNDVCKG